MLSIHHIWMRRVRIESFKLVVFFFQILDRVIHLFEWKKKRTREQIHFSLYYNRTRKLCVSFPLYFSTPPPTVNRLINGKIKPNVIFRYLNLVLTRAVSHTHSSQFSNFGTYFLFFFLFVKLNVSEYKAHSGALQALMVCDVNFIEKSFPFYVALCAIYVYRMYPTYVVGWILVWKTQTDVRSMTGFSFLFFFHSGWVSMIFNLFVQRMLHRLDIYNERAYKRLQRTNTSC